MALADVARLQPGMVVPLDALVGDPVDVIVNGRLIARGEVVVVDDNFCVRVVELIGIKEAA
jgi:flagellar motor switch protein FliN/FliY